MSDNQYIFNAAKRCGIQRCHDFENDWFSSWSPRNGNTNAEGIWAHWVNLAKFILSHPATEIVDPESYRPELKPDSSMYTGGTELSEEQINQLFPSTETD